MDYANKKVYKWQVDIKGLTEDIDEISMNDNPTDEIMEGETQNLNYVCQTRFEQTSFPRRVETPRTHNYQSRFTGNRRKDYDVPLYERSPGTPRYNIPT